MKYIVQLRKDPEGRVGKLSDLPMVAGTVFLLLGQSLTVPLPVAGI